MNDDILTELKNWLDERGYELVRTGLVPNGFEVSIRKQDNPPPLGIHIRDGVGTEDKFGG
jgi:hypothetical protein